MLEVLASAYGARDAQLWYRRWRMFYLPCAELWGYRNGGEWGVAHYLFGRLQLAPHGESAQDAAHRIVRALNGTTSGKRT